MLIVTFRLTLVTFCDGKITVNSTPVQQKAKEEVATSEEVTSVHAVKPSSNCHRSLVYAVVISRSTRRSTRSAVTSAVLRGRQLPFYAVVIRDVIKGSTRSSGVTSSSSTRGRAGFKGQFWPTS